MLWLSCTQNRRNMMFKNDNEVQHHFEKSIYFSLKDISLGINIFSNKELVWGLKGRMFGISINLIIFHFKIGIIRSGF